MLQVPCLSPPIYGHRHYKKFWLKQTSEGVPGSSQSSAPASVSGALEMAAAAAPPASDVSKRISGKRRPQLRKMSSSPEHPQFGWNSPSPSPLSTVENRDSDDPESCKDFFISSAGLSPVDDLPVEAETEAEDKLVVRQNRSCEDISQSSEQTGGGLSQEDQVNRIKSSDTSASDSDSSTSSTSEASDHEDARRHSGKSTTFRQYLKRQSSSTAKVKTGGDEELLGLVSPKTRQASALAVSGPGASPVLATTTTTTNTATVDPVSPRLGSSSPTNSIRTCHHCGTMKTPLWRNGPSGPKSLCNACGIRLRKAKRNNQEGGGATGATGTQASSGKRKLNGETGGGVSAGNGATLSKPQKKSRVPSKRDVRSIPPPTSDDSNTDWDEASAIEVLATLIQLRDAKI